MGGRNGYFQLTSKEEGTFIRIIPQTENGRPVSLKEMVGYLNGQGFSGFDLKELNRAVSNTEQETEVFVGKPLLHPVNETMNIGAELDKMTAYCRFYPPSEGGDLMTEEEIIKDLAFQKIISGINKEEIGRFLADREYCRDYCFAKGKEPVTGKDASIEYFFQTNTSLKPKTNEDGTVDYRNLDTISQVKKGQKLAHLTPEDPGQPGEDIYGGMLTPPQVKSLKLEYGRNITLSEDKLDLISAVDGHVMLIKNQVFVSEVFEVGGDVDNSTGNINYGGNVHIKGSVKSGFEIHAGGNVIIEGVVEDAMILAGGQIVIQQGIHGMNKGTVCAGDNIITKFIENAHVSSTHGYVETDSIIHSTVEAYDMIYVTNKKGLIAGGTVRAGKGIEVKFLGSEMGTVTRAETGIEPALQKRLSEVGEKLKQVHAEMEQIQPILSSYAQKMSAGQVLDEKRNHYVQVLAVQFRNKKAEEQSLSQEKVKLEEELKEGERARIKVMKTAYPGVIIEIAGTEIALKEAKNYCQFYKEGAEIKSLSL